jgi:hypothetical protein
LTKRIYFLYLLVLGLSLVVTLSAHSLELPSNCSDRLSFIQLSSKVGSFENGIIPLDELDLKTKSAIPIKYTSLKTINGQSYTEAELFNDRSDLIIGVDTTGKTKGHMYLIINGVARVDGRMFYAPTTVDIKNLELSDGLILRYKNLPPENKQKLLDWLTSSKNVHGPTCVSVGTKIVFNIADLAPGARDYWFPSTFLRYLTTTGLVGTHGEPVKPDIYLINSEIHYFWNNLPRWRTIPKFLFQVLFDPYTWQGLRSSHRDVPAGSLP